MAHVSGFASLVVLAVVGVLPAAQAQQDPATKDADEPVADPEPPSKPPAPANPFKLLAYEEDWSFLADPDAETDIWFPEIKWMPLGSGWHLSLGGEFRYRYMNQDDTPGFGSRPRHNTFNLYRSMVHADLRHESGFRAYVNIIDARISGNSRPPAPIDQDDLDFLDAFAEITIENTTLRGGRFEMAYGAQRLISPLNWGNTRRSFQGGLVRQQFDDGRVDVFVTQPVRVKPHELNKPRSGVYFSGAYGTVDVEATGDHVDVFALALNQTNDVVQGSSRVGSADTYTLGARYWGKAGDVDYELWAAGQGGQSAGDDIGAYAVAVKTGITVPDWWSAPRFGLVLDYASGDRNPKDDDDGTFNQLFPLGHAYFGALDLVGRQNIIDIQPNVTMKLTDRLTFNGQFHYFRLAADKDALYNAGGAPTLQDTTGASGDNVGTELDLKLSWVPEFLGVNGGIEFGWSQLDPGRFIESQASSKHPTLFYGQLTLRF